MNTPNDPTKDTVHKKKLIASGIDTVNFKNVTSISLNKPTFRSAHLALRPPVNFGKIVPDLSKINVSRDAMKRWEVNHLIKDLPTLPLYVERQFCVAVNFYDNQEQNSPSAVAERVAECLYQLSAVASYKSNASEVSARVTNMYQAEYVIRIFQGRPIDKTDEKIVESSSFFTVEIQKRSGDRGSFYSDAKALMECVIWSKSKKYAGLRNKKNKKPAFSLLAPPSIPNSFTSKYVSRLSSGESSSKEICHKSIKSVSEMLNDESNVDETKFGMEELVCLTDDKVTCTDVSAEIVRIICCDDGSDALMTKMLNLIEHSTLKGVSLQQYGSEGTKRHSLYLRNMALKALVNILSTVFQNETDPSISDKGHECDRIQIKRIVPILVKELTYAKANPHNAYLSAKCITSLVSSSILAKKFGKGDKWRRCCAAFSCCREGVPCVVGRRIEACYC